MKLCTIGFTKKSARKFFTTLQQSGAVRLLDVRLNNVSQLAGFAKRDDLAYFLEAICGIEYRHLPQLAPTKEILDAFKKSKGAWDQYERDFRALMKQRRIETLDRRLFDGACLLCSEDKPAQCHRRLVAEYLRENWSGVEIVHL